MLAAMPEGSLGRAYFEFVQQNGYQSLSLLELQHEVMATWADELECPPLDPDRAWFLDRFMVSHDLQHVVTGYGTDDLGEATLSAFILAQDAGFSSSILTLLATGYAYYRFGWSWLRYVWSAWRRGRRARNLFAVPWEDLLPIPLETVRALLGIEPIHRAHPGGIWAAEFGPRLGTS